MKTLLIIPAYNEEANIEKVVDNIIQNYPQYDYVVVNDGSKDNTAGICRKRGYSFIDLPINLGIGGAVQAGYRYAKRNGYQIAVQVDGDGQHDIAYVEKVIRQRLNYVRKNEILYLFDKSREDSAWLGAGSDDRHD